MSTLVVERRWLGDFREMLHCWMELLLGYMVLDRFRFGGCTNADVAYLWFGRADAGGIIEDAEHSSRVAAADATSMARRVVCC